MKKSKSFFTTTCAWGKIPLRLQVWNFAACGKIGEKQVPVYKGMTISRSFAKATATAALNDAYNTDSQGGQGRASAVRPSIIAAV